MVKVGPIEQHLVSKGFPDAKEISLLIHLDRVISEWITRAIIRAGRRRETNHNCDNRYKILPHAYSARAHQHTECAPTGRQVVQRTEPCVFSIHLGELTVDIYATLAKSAGKILGTSLCQ